VVYLIEHHDVTKIKRVFLCQCCGISHWTAQMSML